MKWSVGSDWSEVRLRIRAVVSLWCRLNTAGCPLRRIPYVTVPVGLLGFSYWVHQYSVVPVAAINSSIIVPVMFAGAHRTINVVVVSCCCGTAGPAPTVVLSHSGIVHSEPEPYSIQTNGELLAKRSEEVIYPRRRQTTNKQASKKYKLIFPNQWILLWSDIATLTPY